MLQMVKLVVTKANMVVKSLHQFIRNRVVRH
jgi:hypothetical protein